MSEFFGNITESENCTLPMGNPRSSTVFNLTPTFTVMPYLLLRERYLKMSQFKSGKMGKLHVIYHMKLKVVGNLKRLTVAS